MEKSLQQHINDDIDELNNPSVNSQRRRFLDNELYELEKYQANHPDDDHDPTELELFCDSHPESNKCHLPDEDEE